MSADFEFNRDRAMEIVQCIKAELPIAAPDSGWSQTELFQLAGACLHVAAQQGLRERNARSPKDEHRERRESLADTFVRDMMLSSRFCGEFNALLHNDIAAFDAIYEPVIVGFVDSTDFDGVLTMLVGKK